VEAGELLGTVTDPVTNESKRVEAPVRGRIIGMAVPQVVIPGYAAFHLGIDAPSVRGESEPQPTDLAARPTDAESEAAAEGIEAEREVDPEVAPE
jgi:hypothetical protein